MSHLLDMIATPGFWRGAIYIGMAMGITLSPDQENAIIAAGLALSGLVHAWQSHTDTK